MKYMKTAVLFLTIFFSLGLNAQVSIKSKPYKNKMTNGLINIEKTYFNYKSQTTKERKTEEIKYYNNSNDTIELYFRNNNKYISLNVNPAKLPPKKEGLIEFEYNPSKRLNSKGDIILGKDYKKIPILIKGHEKKRNSHTDMLILRTFIEEDFSHLSKKELKRAAKIKFDTLIYNFGIVPAGSSIKHDFVFKNTGKEDLEIRYAKGC